MSQEKPKTNKKLEGYGGGRINTSEVGRPKPKTDPNLFKQNSKTESMRGRLKSAAKGGSGASSSDKSYRSARDVQETEKKPLSRLILYPALAVGAFTAGIGMSYCKRNNMMIEELGTLADFAIPLTAGGISFFHEVGSNGGSLDEITEYQIGAGIGGLAGGHFLKMAGEFTGNLIFSYFS
jgi:hypothetical protein